MKKKTGKFMRFVAIVALIATLFAFTGCGTPTGQQGGQTGEPTEKIYEVDLTYASLAYIDSGNAEVDKFVDDVDRAVSVEAADTEEAMLSSAIFKAIDLLKEVPDALSSTAVTCVYDSPAVTGVTVKGEPGTTGTGRHCIVDISSDGAYDMDSYSEMFFIYQIADTILDSFDQIDTVAFTVDGEIVDSLAHIDISKPFTEDMVDAFEGDN